MIKELEEMCYDSTFDTVRAKELLGQIDIDQEFTDTKHGLTSTLLSLATMYANLPFAKLLLECGADPNLIYDNGEETVLWNLQYCKDDEDENHIRLQIAELLLQNGGDPHIKLAGEQEDLMQWAISCSDDDMGPLADYRGKFISLLISYDV